jgi:class 3 adenylate cyclase
VDVGVQHAEPPNRAARRGPPGRGAPSVIGNTTNLAARLQSLTRELEAAVAIDDTTFRRAGRETCAAFVRHADLAIRGRAEPETVHALPL